MTQNRSSAVMQQRSEPHDSLDDFPTPPWATRALCEHLYDTAPVWPLICREPAANRGYMVRPLREYFSEVVASDIHDYGEDFAVRDFLTGPDPEPVDWTITNPPFRLAQAFIRRALRTSREGVAVIVRSAFLEGIERYHNLFAVEPPSRVMQMVERAPMVRGRLDRTAASATAYSWVVWEKRATVSTQFEWIAPCRKRLERVDDYPSDPASPSPPPSAGGDVLMARTLPSWADEPLDRHQAALTLGISPRTLTDRLKQWPYYERRGRKMVFYPEHIRQLREAFNCQDCSSKSEAEHGTPPEPLAASAFEKALALATKPKPKNSGRNMRRGSGNVIPMAKRQ